MYLVNNPIITQPLSEHYLLWKYQLAFQESYGLAGEDNRESSFVQTLSGRERGRILTMMMPMPWALTLWLMAHGQKAAVSFFWNDLL